MNISTYNRDEPLKGYEGKKRMQSFNNFPMHEDTHKNLLDNFREIIDKIDDKIQGNYQKTASNISFNHKNDVSYKNINAEKPLHTYN